MFQPFIHINKLKRHPVCTLILISMKSHKMLEVAVWVLEILTILAFIIAGPLKLMGNPLAGLTLANIDATQWFFYLSGGTGGLKLLKKTEQKVLDHLTQHTGFPMKDRKEA